MRIAKRRRRSVVGPLLETLEGRQLMSVAVASLPNDQYVLGFPFPQLPVLATLSGIPAGTPYTQLTASVSWDSDPAVLNVPVQPSLSGDGTWAIDPLDYPGEVQVPSTPGTHIAHIHFVDAATGEVLDFDAPATAVYTTPNGVNLALTTGQEFSGIIGTTTGVPAGGSSSILTLPLQSAAATPFQNITVTPIQSGGEAVAFTIYWGDGTTSSPTFTDNGDGTFNVIGDHTYTAPGCYQITLQRFITFLPGPPGTFSSDIAWAEHIDLESFAVVSGDPVLSPLPAPAPLPPPYPVVPPIEIGPPIGIFPTGPITLLPSGSLPIPPVNPTPPELSSLVSIQAPPTSPSSQAAVTAVPPAHTKKLASTDLLSYEHRTRRLLHLRTL